MKPDYNNGQWWGWNGGKCPVNPESVVEVRYLADAVIPKPRLADDWIWDHDGNIGDIIVFRVTKPHAESAPKLKRAVFWLTNGRVFQSAREAKTAYPGSEPIRVKACRK